MSSVPVLLYHHIAPDREITPPGFEKQLRWLKEQGFHTLSLKELYDHLKGASPAAECSIAITFDDGYADNWVYAFPLLKKYGMKALLFITTGYISAAQKRRPDSEEGGEIKDTRTAERSPEGFLNWEEVKTMADSGLVEVGSHTHTHKGFRENTAYDNLGRELQQSKEEIETHLQRWSGALAWPWGKFEEKWISLLPQTGYRLAFTTVVGSNEPGRDPFTIRRFKVKQEDISWLSKRLWLYRRPFLAETYGRFYGLDRKLKALLRPAVSLLSILLSLTSLAAEPLLNAPFSDVLKSGREKSKPILLEFYTTWCPPCIKLEKEVLPDPEVQTKLDKFIFARYDSETEVGWPLHQ
ncbi:MAG: polysaccharide deacetylase family protein, partial [Elusimicrobia bacterium]|nr:polysaccharide deacetylase family protein [Elusimicrobiota bacterium]